MAHAPDCRTDVLLAMSVAGKPQPQIADSAGVSVRTVRRWQKHPDNIVAVAAARRDLEQAAIARLAELRERVFEVLAEHLAHGEELVQIRVAKLVLEQGIAHRSAIHAQNEAVLEASLARMEREDAQRFGAGS